MKNKEKRHIRNFSVVIFYIYVVVLVYFVLFSDKYGRAQGYETYQYNLVPFKEISRFIVYSKYMETGTVILNLLGNIFAFSPFGALIEPVRNRKTNIFQAVVFTFLFSMTIEIIQLVTKVGVFDVDDLILNTLGGAIGYIICYIFSRPFKKKPKSKKSSK